MQNDNIEKDPTDKVADHLHNYPDFKRDFAKGFFLGEHEGTYYFWDHGKCTEFKGEYSVANNINNFFSGAIINSNGVRFYPPKMVLSAFVNEQTGETFLEDESHLLVMPNGHPFNAEVLCLETMKRIEEVLPTSSDLNGWNHFIVRLEKLAVENRGKIVQIEGIDHYLFISEESLVIQYATADDFHTFKWKFEDVRGFKVPKKLLIKLIERQKFAV